MLYASAELGLSINRGRKLLAAHIASPRTTPTILPGGRQLHPAVICRHARAPGIRQDLHYFHVERVAPVVWREGRHHFQ